VPLTGDPNELLSPENLWPINGNIGSGTTFETPFIPNNPNQFNANSANIAGYVSIELKPLQKLNAAIGVRLENYSQHYTGQDQLGENVLDNDLVMSGVDLFPSVNLNYNLTQTQNVRFSFTKTIARPSFKEMSYAEIYDPISGRVFIGGMFRDANDIAGIEYWDGNLRSSDIYNVDLRWETFLKEGQNVSVSGFYKYFKNPIEMVQFATQTGAYQPRNVGDAKVYGAELEFKQNLSKLSSVLDGLSLTANITYTKSIIELSKTEYDSRLENARDNQIIEKFRPMAGQSPYIVNSGLSYKAKSSEDKNGFECGFYYNVQGQTLQFVGIADRPDIYAKPFHSLNFNSSFAFGKNSKYQAGIKIDNILNSKSQSVFKSYLAEDQLFSYLHKGRSFHVKLSYNF
jgi:outer membrane receptor protein involved in Fe transport